MRLKKYIFIYLLSLGMTYSYASSEHKQHDGHGHHAVHSNQDNKSHESDAHEHDSHDADDDHGHEDVSEDEDGHAHEHQDEGKAKISDESAKRAGIRSSTTSARTISEEITLTGKITLNKDKTYEIPARFRGIVKDISVKWGQRVKKGQTLAIVESNESLKNYIITSPADGIVLEKHSNIGDVVGDEPLFKVADTSNVWAEFHVFPKNIHSIKEGLPIEIYALGKKNQSSSRIAMLLPTADELSQTVIAIATIPNRNNEWRPGMVVEGDIVVKTIKADVSVNINAIQSLENKTVVFIKDGNGLYAPKEVKIGLTGKNYAEIVSGLKPGENYISEGSFIVKADILKSTAEHTH